MPDLFLSLSTPSTCSKGERSSREINNLQLQCFECQKACSYYYSSSLYNSCYGCFPLIHEACMPDLIQYAAASLAHDWLSLCQSLDIPTALPLMVSYAKCPVFTLWIFFLPRQDSRPCQILNNKHPARFDANEKRTKTPPDAKLCKSTLIFFP